MAQTTHAMFFNQSPILLSK